MATTRTFIAVEVSDGARGRAAELIRRLRASNAKVSWVVPENMHITLKFLGDQSDDDLAVICRSVLDAVAEVPAFDFLCHGAGAFPNLQRPRTVWIGVTEGAAEFVHLHEAVESALAARGFRRENRALTPHLTLGRVRGGGDAQQELGRLIAAHADFPVGLSATDEVLVMASHQRRSGAEYEVLARAPLKLTTDPAVC
jgi:RNA 2',3'-cyclic 3'-phosphodiesterase